MVTSQDQVLDREQIQDMSKWLICLAAGSVPLSSAHGMHACQDAAGNAQARELEPEAGTLCLWIDGVLLIH
jgi:hypothetical protein